MTQISLNSIGSINKRLLSALLAVSLLALLAVIIFSHAPVVSAGNGPGPVMKLTVDSIKGDIDATAFSWQVDNKPVNNGGGGGGKPTFSDLEITAKSGPGSVRLFQMASSGEHIKKVSLTVDQPNGGTLTINLEDVLVTSYGNSAADDNNSTFDQLSLDYAKIVLQYNGAGGNWTGGWDIKNNKKL